MSTWIHLSLDFKKIEETTRRLYADASQESPQAAYRELTLYLKAVVEALSPDLINRYFFLFEPNPPLFMALEVRDMAGMDSIKERVDKITPPVFVDWVKLDLNTHDETNGEPAIDFFHAGTKYAFYRAGNDYKPGYANNDPVKLVHCLCNQLFVSLQNERDFYLRRLNFQAAKPREGKMQKPALIVAGIIFLVVAVMHLLRLFYRWPAQIGPLVIPLWLSAIGALFALSLAIWMFKAL
jgi:hypothetical protein